MQMFGHDNPFVQIHVFVSRRQPFPRIRHHATIFIHYHCATHDLTKQTFPALHTEGNEIGARQP